jgi:two-component system, chemotaxis family, response regulator WspF
MLSLKIAPLRIAIVNDTLIATEVLRRAVCSIPQYQLAWTAKNGMEAVDRCAQDTPDLILMDLLMPIMDGVEATRQIMSRSPCAILLVTASVNRFASKVFEAMGHGALDAVNTPVLGLETSDPQSFGLFRKIAMIAKLLGRSPSTNRPQINSSYPNLTNTSLPSLVVMGASTGGPQAIATVLGQLPKESKLAIVVVQHIDTQFAPGLAAWLNQQSPLPVQMSRPGTILQAGTVTLAGGDRHLVMRRDGILAHQVDRENMTYCPSIDVFFQSVAAHWAGAGVGVLLTGMGRDGAVGLKHLADAGWQTIAQDEATSVVYGMPKAAIALNAARQVLPIQQIAPACIAGIRRGNLSNLA